MIHVRVPASSANLGPGFDALGLALALYDEVDVEVIDSGLTVRVDGEGAGSVPMDESHLVVRALRLAADRLGVVPPGLAVRCRNAIPHARGLGSSAAAIVAGIAAAYGLAGREPDSDALQLAAELEGHADNAAASLLGGLVLAWREGDRFRALRLEPHADLRPIALVPRERSATSVTRGLLPERVPHADAAFGAARCALAVQALTARPDLLLAATEDRLHQDYRSSAWPATMRLVRALRETGVAATVSGAGPTVLACTVDGKLPGEVDLSGFTACELPVDRTGVTVRRQA
ncbi:MAG TPA: homoserine kinase [Actinophytocola sp.]|uniref:homoserine kinase n=1 Tax=Actinophytocola sp. TaxID=1872138 RepID=UPI002DDCEE43|nr:homoserine kinase [Actinophytocola sp.]HEV2778294.1 homoserine kinase [Actinophytocola sp.]